MRKINVALIGSGNVIKTRHLPSLKKHRRLFNILGIIDVDAKSAEQFAVKYKIPYFQGITNESDLANITWLSEVEAVIIGTPPDAHFSFSKQCLLLQKHVLVEKPFTLTVEEARELVDLAKQNNKALAVKHNFQYTRSFLKLSKLIDNEALGKIKSMYCVQLTNHTRRIPSWTERLPIGLFYDESPHYFYLIPKFAGGKINIKSVYKSDSPVRISTPEIINLNLEANQIPVTIYWNFDSPVCEWYFTVFGEKKSATVDLFRDILIVLPDDTPHLGYQVMRTSVLGTFQHWKGIVLNGFSYLQNKLYYGFDIAQKNFYLAIVEDDLAHIKGMSGEDGLYVTEIQNQIVDELRKIHS